MKIVVAILANENYLLRITNAFNQKYSDFEVLAFSDSRVASNNLKNQKIDVFIIEESFYTDIIKYMDLNSFSYMCSIAYFVEKKDISEYKGKPAICMSQKVSDIYNQIVSIYSENITDISIKRSDKRNSKILLFSSPCGGVGTSSLACACSIILARNGFRTLYLNFEKFPSTDILFSGEGAFNIREIIHALKSENKDVLLPLKLKSSVKISPDGVYYYSAPDYSLDMTEINVNEIIDVINQTSSLDQDPYNYIIIDTDFSLKEDYIDLFKEVDSIVMVSNGSEISNNKIYQAYKSFEALENQGEISVLYKLNLIYNIFGSQTGRRIEGININVLGGIQRIANASVSQIIGCITDLISKGNLFANLF